MQHTVVLCNLTMQVYLILVLKHITSTCIFGSIPLNANTGAFFERLRINLKLRLQIVRQFLRKTCFSNPRKLM